MPLESKVMSSVLGPGQHAVRTTHGTLTHFLPRSPDSNSDLKLVLSFEYTPVAGLKTLLRGLYAVTSVLMPGLHKDKGLTISFILEAVRDIFC